MSKSAKEVLNFSVKSIFAGALIGVAGVAYLLAVKGGSLILGSVLFSFALLAIITNELKLFTGTIALLPKTPLRKFWVLPVCFVCNFIGVAFIALLVNSSFVGESILETAVGVAEAKIGHGVLSAFLTGVLCGICIAFSVVSGDESRESKSPYSWIGIAFPVVIFVFCGFEHCIADMAYFFFARAAVTWEVVWFFAAVVAGNLIGGPLILLTKNLSKKLSEEE